MKIKKPSEEQIRAWGKEGYSKQFREYTARIENNPDLVMEFLARAGDDFTDALEVHPLLKPALDAIDESLDAFEIYSGGNLPEVLVEITKTTPNPTVEIFFEAQAGAVLWDRLSIKCDDPVALLTMFYYRSLVSYKLPSPISRVVVNPMHRFHPERYRFTRRFSKLFAKVYKQNAQFSSGAITTKDYEQLVGSVFKEVNERRFNYPLRGRSKDKTPANTMTDELTFGAAYGRFVQAGRQIMDFPPSLCEMLSKTDIRDIPVGRIKLPYVCQYLQLGTQQNLELEPDWFVDGAYVESRGVAGEIKIVLTAKPPSEDVSDLWYLKAEPSYSQSFNEKHSEIDIATALEDVLSERLKVLFGQEERSEGTMFKEAIETLVEEGLPINPRNVVDISGETARTVIDTTNRRYPVFLEALKLIVNCLLYITAYPEDIKTTWSDKAPADVRHKAIHGNAKDKAKARSKLEELGYSAVHLCGSSFKIQNQQAANNPIGEGHKSLHWRRGHWRNQRFGEGRTQLKLLWIMPMLVGAKNQPGDDPELGHVYLVS